MKHKENKKKNIIFSDNYTRLIIGAPNMCVVELARAKNSKLFIKTMPYSMSYFNSLYNSSNLLINK